ncbi:MAG: mucoidy inhibitor MuiA family protein [Candidatus Omnitrophota bacterium]|jgi:uncharacterized protein (TIGR02231 family)
MRKLIFLLAAIFSAFTYSIAQDIQAESKITKVNVYLGSALITRSVELKLSQGSQNIVLSGIVPEIDENSLRVSGKGSAEAKILGAEVKKEFLKDVPQEKVKKLQEGIQSLRDERRKTEDLKKILVDEKAFLDSVRLFSAGQIPKEMVTKMPPASELENILKFMDAKLKDNYSQAVDAELKTRDIDKRIDVLNRELIQIVGPVSKVKRSIVAEIEVLRSGSLVLDFSYMAKGASWYPIYDARVDFEKAKTELISYAAVRQNTGEDWQGVNFMLSTAKINISGKMPEIEPWFLRPYESRILDRNRGYLMMKKKQALGDMVSVAAGSASTTDRLDDSAVNQYAQPEEKGISVVYNIARPVSIKSDGHDLRLPVFSQSLDSVFKYSSYPRYSPYAYLFSRVINCKDLQLIGGKVNVFLDGDFVGASAIENIGPQEEFDLYLGVDENVKIKREEIGKKVDDVIIGGIPSPTKKTSFKYKLSVENYKNKKIKIELFEAMPVSQNDRIKVTLGNVSLQPVQKDWKDKKGIW